MIRAISLRCLLLYLLIYSIQKGEIMIQYLSKETIKVYHFKLKEKNNEASNFIGAITLVLLIISAILYTLFLVRLLPIFDFSLIALGLSFLMFIIWILVKYYYISEKPLYAFLYPKLIEDISYNDDVIIKYSDYPKIKEILKASQLFTKFASNKTRAGFTYTDRNGNTTSIYDTYYYTQSNNSTITHFNGYYIVIEGVNAKPIQIRTKGRPSRSSVPLKNIVNDKKYKIYSEHANSPSHEDIKKIFETFNKRLNPKNLFLSVVDDHLYIAIDMVKPMRKIPKLDEQSYAELRNRIIGLIDTISEANSFK